MNTDTSHARSPRRDPPALAVVGCGAIARSFHLPALAKEPGVLERVVLLDPDLDRARALGRDFGISAVAADCREVMDRIQGAIILTPHHLHHRIARECLDAGVSVLSEKPLAESAEDVRDLIGAARRTGAAIAVNNTRRLIPACRKVAELVRSGAIGRLEAIEFHEGDRFDWPSASGAMFGRRGQGRGVLMDVGAHVLDLVCWWLGARPSIADYQDDSLGVSEAVAHAELAHGACRISVRLSWLSKLRNGYVLRGERGTIEGGIYDWNAVVLTTRAGKRSRIATGPEIRAYTELGTPLLRNFVAVVEGRERPLVSAEDVLPSIELIQDCYARRRPFEMPWHDTLDRFMTTHA